MHRTQPSTKTHVQLLQWLHGKQQQQQHGKESERIQQGKHYGKHI